MFGIGKRFNPQDVSTNEIHRFVSAGQTLSLETWAQLTEQQKEAAERAHGENMSLRGIVHAFFASIDPTDKTGQAQAKQETLARVMQPYDGGQLDKTQRQQQTQQAFNSSPGVKVE